MGVSDEGRREAEKTIPDAFRKQPNGREKERERALDTDSHPHTHTTPTQLTPLCTETEVREHQNTHTNTGAQNPPCIYYKTKIQYWYRARPK